MGILFSGTNGASVWRRDIDVNNEYAGSELSNLVIYPNPAYSAIQFNINAKSIRSSYQLFNEYGQLVLTGSLNQGLNTIEIKQLTAGVYILKVFDSESAMFKKIVKN